ncbi:hypothetical protein D3C84_959610 [compost metagenome]
MKGAVLAIALDFDRRHPGVLHTHITDADIAELPCNGRFPVVELGIRVVVIQGEDEGLLDRVANRRITKGHVACPAAHEVGALHA